METGLYWPYTLSKEEQSRFCGSSKHLLSQEGISISALELLSMVMSAYVLVVVCRERPAGDSDCILLRGDNEAAARWVRRCGGSKESRSGALTCLLGGTELAGGWYVDSFHVSGTLNDAADGISRWESCKYPQEAHRSPFLDPMAGAGLGGRRLGTMYVSVGREIVRQAVAGTSERTYKGYFGCLAQFCVSLGLPVSLVGVASVDSNVCSLLACVVHTWGTNGLQACAIADHLAAV